MGQYSPLRHGGSALDSDQWRQISEGSELLKAPAADKGYGLWQVHNYNRSRSGVVSMGYELQMKQLGVRAIWNESGNCTAVY
jgi:hypothetical protein